MRKEFYFLVLVRHDEKKCYRHLETRLQDKAILSYEGKSSPNWVQVTEGENRYRGVKDISESSHRERNKSREERAGPLVKCINLMTSVIKKLWTELKRK